MTKQKKIVVSVLAGIGGLLALLLLCGGIGAALGVGQQPASKSAGVPEAVSTHIAATRSASPTKAAPTKAAPTRTAQPSPTQASARERLSAWYLSGGQTRINNLAQDMDDISTAGQSEDVAGMYQASTQMRQDVAAAQAYAPIPDAQGQALWAAALKDFGASALDLNDGIGSGNTSKITRATTEMDAGTADLKKLTDRIKTLSGS